MRTGGRKTLENPHERAFASRLRAGRRIKPASSIPKPRDKTCEALGVGDLADPMSKAIAARSWTAPDAVSVIPISFAH
jgi:hypothetical protein